MTELSVIVPCFNAEATVGLQLEALIAQTCTRTWEIVLADNGSTDRSVAVAEAYRARLPRLRIVDALAVRGPAHARNVGVAAADGNRLCFCDADDEVAPYWLSAMADGLDRHTCVAGAMEFDRLNPPWTPQDICFQRDALSRYPYYPYLPFFAGGNVGYRRELADTIGPWDESMLCGEDVDYAWRIQQAGVSIAFLPDAVVHYRKRSTLLGNYRQARSRGETAMILRQRYDPSLKKFQALRRLVWLVRHIPSIPLLSFSKGQWAAWLWDWGDRVGQLRSAVRRSYRSCSPHGPTVHASLGNPKDEIGS